MILYERPGHINLSVWFDRHFSNGITGQDGNVLKVILYDEQCKRLHIDTETIVARRCVTKSQLETLMHLTESTIANWERKYHFPRPEDGTKLYSLGKVWRWIARQSIPKEVHWPDMHRVKH